MSESTEYIAGGDIISRGGGALIYPHNKYYSVDEIRKLEDGAELEALTANGKHYYVVYHRTKGTAEQIHLSYPNWGSEYDFRGDITNCCLTWRGHYSSAAGLNRKTNTYSSQNMLPVVIGIGKIVNPRHKYYSREEIRNLPDRSKVDILTAENGNLIHVHGLYRCPLEGNPYIHYPNWSDSFNTTGDVFDMCLSDRGAYSNGDMRHRKGVWAPTDAF